MYFNIIPYILTFLLLSISFYGLASSKNYFKRLISLGLMQVSVIILFILFSYSKGSSAPFIGVQNMVNPLPHVLMLTAIVVGLALLSVGLSLVLRLREEFSSINEANICEEKK